MVAVTHQRHRGTARYSGIGKSRTEGAAKGVEISKQTRKKQLLFVCISRKTKHQTFDFP